MSLSFLVLYGQSVKTNDIPLEQFLSELSESYKIHFSYSDPLVKGKYISGSCAHDLISCLQEKLYPTGIDFKFINEERIALFSMEIMEVNGFIRDSITHEPLIGAHIYNVQLGQGTITDENGFFRLFTKRIDSIYHISYIGYQGKTINTQEYLTKQWYLSPSLLDPIVVLGKDLSYISKYVLEQDEKPGLLREIDALIRGRLNVDQVKLVEYTKEIRKNTESNT